MTQPPLPIASQPVGTRASALNKQNIVAYCEFADELLSNSFWNSSYKTSRKILDVIFDTDVIETLKNFNIGNVRRAIRDKYIGEKLELILTELEKANDNDYEQILMKAFSVSTDFFAKILIESKKEAIWHYLENHVYAVFTLPKTRFFLKKKEYREIIEKILKQEFAGYGSQENENTYNLKPVSYPYIKASKEIQSILSSIDEIKFKAMTEWKPKTIFTLAELKMGIDEGIYGHLTSVKLRHNIEVGDYKVEYYNIEQDGFHSLIFALLKDNKPHIATLDDIISNSDRFINQRGRILGYSIRAYEIMDITDYYIEIEEKRYKPIKKVINNLKYRLGLKLDDNSIIRIINEGIKVWKGIKDEKRNTP